MVPPRRSLAVTLHDLSTPPRGPFTSRNETPISRMSRSKRPAANCSRRSLSRFKTVRAVASKTRIRNNMGFPFFKSPALLRSPAGSDIFLDGRALTRMPTAYNERLYQWKERREDYVSGGARAEQRGLLPTGSGGGAAWTRLSRTRNCAWYLRLLAAGHCGFGWLLWWRPPRKNRFVVAGLSGLIRPCHDRDCNELSCPEGNELATGTAHSAAVSSGNARPAQAVRR